MRGQPIAAAPDDAIVTPRPMRHFPVSSRSLSRFLIGLAAMIICVTGPAPSIAASDGVLRTKVDALGKGGYAAKARAAAALAATGDPRALPILQAFLRGRLYARRDNGRVFEVVAETDDGYTVIDPLTRKERQTLAADAMKKARVNNRVRRAIRAAMASLNLFSTDKAVRLRAAENAFRSRKPSFEPLLQKALAVEKDAEVQERLKLALAASVIANSTGTDKRVAAVKSLSGNARPEVVALLKPLTAIDAAGKPAEPDPAVRAAALKTLGVIEDRLALFSVVGDLFRGISLGSVLLLAAIGLAITFGVMGVINMAHGEMVMLGAYTTFTVQEVIRASAPNLFDYSLFMALPLAFLAAALVGIAMERSIIRFLYGRPLETLLATWGVSLILQQAIRVIFGAQNREVGNPSWMSGGFEILGGVTLTYNRLWIILFSLMVFAALLLIMRRTSLGLKMRAVTQNRPMASAMGIRNGRVDALTFGLGSGIAGIAGVALSQITNVSPNLGQNYIIDSFMVVVFGGVGNLWGTLVGALSLGVVNKFLEPYSGAVLGKILVLVFIILFIQRRPRGLFALKGRAVDS